MIIIIFIYQQVLYVMTVRGSTNVHFFWKTSGPENVPHLLLENVSSVKIQTEVGTLINNNNNNKTFI